MSDFLFNTQFSCRLPQTDVDFLNENIHHLLPAINEVKNRDVFMHMAESCISKKAASHHPEDLQLIETLQAELKKYQAIQAENARNAQALSEQIEFLQRESTITEEKISMLENDISLKNETIAVLSQQVDELASEIDPLRSRVLSIENPTKVIIDLTPGQYHVTEIYRQKVSEAAKTEVTIPEMLFDLFWKYVTQQKTQIAFPFFLNNAQIKKILSLHQPLENEQ
jgi:predicted RNase H-like nuclease (RuvC/YqgF family)